MNCIVSSYLTNRVPVSDVQFRAGSSIRGSGGTLHPAEQIILHPGYCAYPYEFNVAVVRVSDNVSQNTIFENTSLNWVQTRSLREEISFKI